MQREIFHHFEYVKAQLQKPGDLSATIDQQPDARVKILLRLLWLQAGCCGHSN